MKIALYNAKVYVERERFVEAVLVEDRKIKAIGTNEEILATTDIDEKIEFLRGMLNKFEIWTTDSFCERINAT